MTRVGRLNKWAVYAQTRLQLDASADEVWAIVQRFNTFIAANPYHTRVTDAPGNQLDTLPPKGTALRIGHGIGLTWFERIGTLTRVLPGRALIFTDLSKRGRHADFPHVYKYRITPISDRACELGLTVRGSWSARWLPRAVVRGWLWWVMTQAHWSLRIHTTCELDRIRKQKKKNLVNPDRKAVTQ